MDVCQLLLGRPWQYDRNAIHEGRSDTYVFRHVGIKRVLQPMGNNAIKIDHLFVHKEFLKSAQKPRTVSLKGGEDDTVTAGILVVPPLLSSKTSSNQETRYENKMQKYVVPALRHKKIMCATEQRGVLGVKSVLYATERRWSYALPIERNNIATIFCLFGCSSNRASGGSEAHVQHTL